MSFLLFVDALHNRVSDLQKRFESGESLTPVRALSKLALYGGKRLLSQSLVKPYKQDCLNIAISVTGGIGDICMQFQWAKTFVEELTAHDCKFAVVLLTENKAFVQRLTSGLDIFDGIFTNKEFGRSFKADLYLNLYHLVTPVVVNEQALQQYAPFLVEQISECSHNQNFWTGDGRAPALFDDVSEHFLLVHQARFKGYDLRDMLGSSGLCHFDRRSPLWFPVEHEQVQKTLERFKLSGRKFILVCSSVGGITMPDDISKEQAEFYRTHATKLIPPELAEGFIKLIKQELPEYLVVQMGPKESVEFSGCDLNLIGCTSYDESINLLYVADCFIGNDSGNVHLRHAMGKSSVVLWGPTPADYIGYDTDFNIQSVCRACARVPCDGCMWSSLHWNVICPAGFEQPECMKGIKPEHVLTGVRAVLMNTEETYQILRVVAV